MVFVRGVTTDDSNSFPDCSSRAVLSARSFEPSNSFWAAFAFLLGRFLAFPMVDSLVSLLLDSHYPPAADNLITAIDVVKDRRLSRRDRSLRFVKNNAGTSVR